MPKVSIIVPIYNAEKYLEDTVNSIINSTIKDIEIILIDDGSEDKSLNICNKLKSKDNRILVIHQENRGLSATRNIGIDIANGDYITFCDSDDIVENDMYKLLYNNAIKEDADISMCGIVVEKKNGKEKYIYDTKKRYIWTHLQALEYFLKNEMFGVSSNTKLFKKSLLEKIRFREVSVCEDKLFLSETIINSNKICFEDVCKYRYIKRENSITTSKFSNKKIDAINVEKEIYKYIEKYIKYNQKLLELSNNRIIMAKLSILRECIGKKSYKEYKNLCKELVNDIKSFKNLRRTININMMKKLEIYSIKYCFPIYYMLVSILYCIVEK